MSKLYTLLHPTLRNVQINSPAGDGSRLLIDSTGHVRNVPSMVAEKLSRSGYALLGSDAGLISFEAKMPVYADACVAFERARSAFVYALREALSSGVSLEALEEVVAKHPRAELVNLRGLLTEGNGPSPAWASAPAPQAAVPVAPAVRIDAPVRSEAPPKVAAEAPAVKVAAEAPAVEAPVPALPVAAEPEAEAAPESRPVHWKVKIAVAKAMGADLPADNERDAAEAFLHAQSLEAVQAAIEDYRRLKQK